MTEMRGEVLLQQGRRERALMWEAFELWGRLLDRVPDWRTSPLVARANRRIDRRRTAFDVTFRALHAMGLLRFEGGLVKEPQYQTPEGWVPW